MFLALLGHYISNTVGWNMLYIMNVPLKLKQVHASL